MQPCFTPFSISNASESSLLEVSDAIIPVCYVDTSLTKWLGDHSFCRMFLNTFLFTVLKAFVKLISICRRAYSVQCISPVFVIRRSYLSFLSLH